MASDKENAVTAGPLFRAVASSTRSLLQLLKAISFSNKIHVEITEDGLRFAADHGRVMHGVAHWNRNLFTTYTTNLRTGEDNDRPVTTSFRISLPALLETLQIFGASDAAARQAKADADPYRSNLRNYRPEAFTNQILGVAGTCSFSYGRDGDPFSILLEEAGVKTTCNITTYVAESSLQNIPFDMNALSFKIITQARWFLDALAEMVPTAPEKLTLVASRGRPFLRLTSSSGQLGSSTVDFSQGRDLLETFSVRDRWAQTFKFDIVKSATEAMRIASKISLRGDEQGVLSMQFMVEVEGAGVNFLDFRFVPYATQEDGGEGETEDEGEEVTSDGQIDMEE